MGLIIQDIEYEALLCDDGAVTVSCKLVGVERLDLARSYVGISRVPDIFTSEGILHHQMVGAAEGELGQLHVAGSHLLKLLQGRRLDLWGYGQGQLLLRLLLLC